MLLAYAVWILLALIALGVILHLLPGMRLGSRPMTEPGRLVPKLLSDRPGSADPRRPEWRPVLGYG